MISKFFILLSVLFLSTHSLQAATELEKSDRFRRLGPSHEMTVKITVSDSKDLSVYTVLNDDESSLAIQSKPERSADRKLLMKEEDLWLFTPQTSRAIKIGMDQRLVGDVSYGDILRTRFREDYTSKKISQDNQEIVLELIKSSKSAAYHKIIYHLSAKTLKPIKALFYAPSGKLLKTADFIEYKKVLNELIVTKIKISDSATQRTSLIEYTNFKKRNFSPETFNKESISGS